MSVDAAIIIAIFVLIASFLAIVVIFGTRYQKAKEDEFRRAASARGWKFETKHERGYRVHRWVGATDGIPWVAESLKHSGGGSRRQRHREIARWHGAWSPGVNGAIVGMGVPKGKEVLGESVADGDGFFARLAQKAAGFAFDKAIDVYFGKGPGKEVDAATMQRVDSRIPGFIVMADNKEEGARILSTGSSTHCSPRAAIRPQCLRTSIGRGF